MAKDQTEAAAGPVVAVPFEMLKELIEAVKGSASGIAGMSAEDFAKINAEANRQVLRPENPQAPDVSCYNPLGERDHPRAAFICHKVYQNGIELEREHLDREEIELINALKPGQFKVTKTDGTQTEFLVKDERDANGKLAARHMTFRAKERHDLIGLPGLKAMLREVLGLAPTSAEEVALRERVAVLEARLAGTAA